MTVVTTPTNGSVTVVSDGTLRYTPNAWVLALLPLLLGFAAFGRRRA